MSSPMKVTINFNHSLGSESLLFKEVVALAESAGECQKIGNFQGVIVKNIDYQEAFKFLSDASLLVAKHNWHTKVRNVSLHIMPYIKPSSVADYISRSSKT